MVLWYKKLHDYSFNFETVTMAFFNKYPNPYSTHVQSVDTIDRYIKDGKLYSTRLIRKKGKLPKWVLPFLGKISHTWVIEKTILNPETKTLQSYTRNLDHTLIMRVEEYTTYQYDESMDKTTVLYNVKFSSRFKGFGVRERIEAWSHNRFKENIKNTTNGMAYVMRSWSERRKSLWRGQQQAAE